MEFLARRIQEHQDIIGSLQIDYEAGVHKSSLQHESLEQTKQRVSMLKPQSRSSGPRDTNFRPAVPQNSAEQSVSEREYTAQHSSAENESHERRTDSERQTLSNQKQYTSPEPEVEPQYAPTHSRSQDRKGGSMVVGYLDGAPFEKLSPQIIERSDPSGKRLSQTRAAGNATQNSLLESEQLSARDRQLKLRLLVDFLSTKFSQLRDELDTLWQRGVKDGRTKERLLGFLGCLQEVNEGLNLYAL